MEKPQAGSTPWSIVAGLAANLLLSWTVLPLAIPPVGAYPLRDLVEVLMWQAIGAIGWPLAIVGGLFSTVLQPTSADPGALLLTLMYPAMLGLLILVVVSKRARRWALILLHVLLTFSFAAVWYQVLNGYDFGGG